MKYLSYVANAVTLLALCFIAFSSFSWEAEKESSESPEQNTVSNESFLGEVRITMSHLEPVGWRVCKGQEIEISRNNDLFDQWGDVFGGTATWNTETYKWEGTFKLPDLESKRLANFGTANWDYYNVIGTYIVCTLGKYPVAWDAPWGDSPQYYEDGIPREW